MGGQREESALNMFRQMDLKGKNAKDDTQLKTVHQNTISTLRTYEETGGSIRKFSSKYWTILELYLAEYQADDEQQVALTAEWSFGQPRDPSLEQERVLSFTGHHTVNNPNLVR